MKCKICDVKIEIKDMKICELCLRKEQEKLIKYKSLNKKIKSKTMELNLLEKEIKILKGGEKNG